MKTWALIVCFLTLTACGTWERTCVNPKNAEYGKCVTTYTDEPVCEGSCRVK